MRDGNGPRGLDILARYRGLLLAELFRSLAALDAAPAQSTWAPRRRCPSWPTPKPNGLQKDP